MPEVLIYDHILVGLPPIKSRLSYFCGSQRLNTGINMLKETISMYSFSLAEFILLISKFGYEVGSGSRFDHSQCDGH